MGIPVDRVAMAQCASEEMIKQLIRDDEIYRYSRNSVKCIMEDMQGRTVSTLSTDIGTGHGEQIIQFPDQAAAGMYLIRITGAELNRIKPVELVH